jgi:ArsR family transcriptional regulator, lead/cadmium/zinc/bismuth-responsive transcriptional repressor
MTQNTCIRVFANQKQIDDCREIIKANSESFIQLGKVLELAGNEVRLKILFLLDEEKELCPCDMSDILGLSIPAVSQHLRKMRDGNIIESRREAQTIFYSLKAEHIKILRPFFKYISKETSLVEKR